MITYIRNIVYGEELHYVELGCVHTDTKPTDGIATGSLALEADTGDLYAFDGTTWQKING